MFIGHSWWPEKCRVEIVEGIGGWRTSCLHCWLNTFVDGCHWRFLIFLFLFEINSELWFNTDHSR